MNDLQFGEYRIDSGRRILLRSQDVVPLPSKAFDLLVFMAVNAGRVLTKDELLSAVWPDSIVEESNLTQNVFFLRKALGGGSRTPILTVPGRGYQFTAPVVQVPSQALISEAPVEFFVTNTNGEAHLEARHSRLVYEEETEVRIAVWHSPAAVAGLFAVILLLCVMAWLGWKRWEDRVGGPPVQVVLADFEGGTGDPVLDRTLRDVLRFDLGQSPFVNVVPASTVQSLLPAMQRKATDFVTIELARDICERTGSQAVLQVALGHFGQRYVVTGEAVNCVDGATLGRAKEEAATEDGLPNAIDHIGTTLRHELGESRRTIARFNRPLASEATGSLEALKDFSQAVRLSQTGSFAEAIGLLKQAVVLDPHFAAAYYNLAAYYSNVSERASARLYLQKAYEVREYATEPSRFAIVSLYHSDITGDLYESLRNDRNWVDMYPRNATAWNGLALVYGQLGRFEDGAQAAKRELYLLPNNISAYQIYASGQINSGDYVGARKTCELALAHGFDVDMIRERMLTIAYATQDVALLEQQRRWAQGHADSPLFLSTESEIAIGEGRIQDSQMLLDKASEAFSRQGTPDAGIHLRQLTARMYIDVGLPSLGKRELMRAPVDPGELQELLATAELGQTVQAGAMLDKELETHPQSTILTRHDAPLVRCAIAMTEGKPSVALTDIDPIRSFEGRSLDSYYLEGKAALESAQPVNAEAAFRKLISLSRINPTSYQIPLATLGLARALHQQGRRTEALSAYDAFLQFWKHADGKSPLQDQANAERAAVASKIK